MDIKNKKFHFIAIGGVGMSGLAKYLAKAGAIVSGSDSQESKYTSLLNKIGVTISIGHNINNIKSDMTVVASSAIKEDNPEIIRAKELGLKIYHRSDILKLISDEYSRKDDAYFIGFSGTHGKTTTSGLCSYVLSKAGLNPSYVVGGIIPELNTNAEYNFGKYFIAELDESDGTIQKYSTDTAVINNMEEDHLDYYKNGFKDIAYTFNKYLLNKPAQKVIINTDNEGNRNFIKLYKNFNFITFGLNNADYTAKNIEIKGFTSSFDIYAYNKKICKINLSIPGMHNIYNALAVASALAENGISISDYAEYFTSFTGMGRRFQKICEFNGISIYDDYAHHPSEIKTTLRSIKEGAKDNNRIVAVFQPHRYTRLKSLWNEFKTSFDNSDKLYITDIYSAGETPINGITSDNFCKDFNDKKAEYIKGSIEDIAKNISNKLQPNDIVITLGAGTITNLGKYIYKEYQEITSV